MWTHFGDVENSLALWGELRRRFDRAFDDFEPYDVSGTWGAAEWPKVNVYDTGEAFVLEADVPGIAEKDIRLTVEEAKVTLEGERKESAPEGYSPQRRERSAFRFSRSFTLPVKADAETSVARVKDGVLTVTLPKAAESKPRQIEVRVG